MKQIFINLNIMCYSNYIYLFIKSVLFLLTQEVLFVLYQHLNMISQE